MSFTLIAVEDSPVDALIIRKMFQSLVPDIDFHHFDNGAEALKYMQNREDKADMVILLDMNMPVLGGLEFLSKREQDTALKDIPVITLSSHYGPGEKEATAEHGVTLHLEKPILKDTARKVLEEIQQIRMN
jgi:CheY-like chemotaxis protein